MPARAVVFNSIRKHDGSQFRVLEPGEYTQMAGRAGRRGLDKVGTVIMCCFGEEPPPQPLLKQMLTGSSTLLSSQFRLTYNMILNLLRVEEMSVESMIARSFSEFATQRALTAQEYPRLLHRGKRTREKLDADFRMGAADRVGLEDLEEYYNLSLTLLRANQDILDYVVATEADLLNDICCPGRVVLVSAARKYNCVRAPAIVLRSTISDEDLSRNRLICLILLPTSYVSKEDSKLVAPSRVDHVGACRQRYFTIRSLGFDQIFMISSRKHKINAESLCVDDGRKSSVSVDRTRASSTNDGRSTDRWTDPFARMTSIGKNKSDRAFGRGQADDDDELGNSIGFLLDAEKAEQDRTQGLPSLALSGFVKRGAEAVAKQQLCVAVSEIVCQVRSLSCHYNPNLEKYYGELERKETLRKHLETLQHLLSNESLSLFPDFMNKKAVLRKLGYIDESDTVSVKGRVACECNSSEELILTEMVFEGILNDLEPEEIAAVLSALVFQGRSTDEELDMELPDNLVACCSQMRTIATNLGVLQKELGVKVDPAEYADTSMNFGLVHVVYEWALGVPFKNICDLTDIKEGLIVRAITRLDELLREVRNCARVIGNPSLYRALDAASVAIKRDIVFASSLYVS